MMTSQTSQTSQTSKNVLNTTMQTRSKSLSIKELMNYKLRIRFTFFFQLCNDIIGSKQAKARTFLS